MSTVIKMSHLMRLWYLSHRRTAKAKYLTCSPSGLLRMLYGRAISAIISGAGSNAEWWNVDEKARFRNQYNRIPYPATDTKWERNIHNWDDINDTSEYPRDINGELPKVQTLGYSAINGLRSTVYWFILGNIPISFVQIIPGHTFNMKPFSSRLIP